MVFGKEKNKGIKLDGFKPIVISLDEHNLEDCWIHDPSDKIKASILTNLFDYHEDAGSGLPRPFGVIYQTERYTYEDLMKQQIDDAVDQRPTSLDELLQGKNHWEI